MSSVESAATRCRLDIQLGRRQPNHITKWVVMPYRGTL